MNTRLIVSASLAALLSACYVGGPRAYTRGTYEDPNVIEIEARPTAFTYDPVVDPLPALGSTPSGPAPGRVATQ